MGKWIIISKDIFKEYGFGKTPEPDTKFFEELENKEKFDQMIDEIDIDSADPYSIRKLNNVKKQLMQKWQPGYTLIWFNEDATGDEHVNQFLLVKSLELYKQKNPYTYLENTFEFKEKNYILKSIDTMIKDLR